VKFQLKTMSKNGIQKDVKSKLAAKACVGMLSVTLKVLIMTRPQKIIYLKMFCGQVQNF